MRHPDDVFAAYVDANPVPDTAVLTAERPPMELLFPELERGIAMTDVTDISGRPAETQAEAPVATGPSKRGRWLAVAAVAAAALAGIVLASQILDSDEIAPADPQGAIETEALAAADRWFAVQSVEERLAISSPEVSDVRNQRLYAFNEVFADHGFGVHLITCRIAESTAASATVKCDVTQDDPVFEAVGSATVVYPFTFSEGLLTWHEIEDTMAFLVNQAYSQYLAKFHLEEYQSLCSPGGYDPAEAITYAGMALTAECARLAAPVADEVAQWVRDGRP